MTDSIRICSIEGCGNKHHGRGMCQSHYSKYRRSSDFAPTRAVYSTPEESFAGRTEWQGECLVWVGRTNHDGYGIISGVSTGSARAHRYAWERVNGKIPDSSEIDHICHRRNCVNVSHLRLASRYENNSNLSGARAGSVSGVRNVYWRAPVRKWQVTVRSRGVLHSFGYYSCLDEAAAVAEEARKELFGEFAGKG